MVPGLEALATQVPGRTYDQGRQLEMGFVYNDERWSVHPMTEFFGEMENRWPMTELIGIGQSIFVII